MQRLPAQVPLQHWPLLEQAWPVGVQTQAFEEQKRWSGLKPEAQAEALWQAAVVRQPQTPETHVGPGLQEAQEAQMAPAVPQAVFELPALQSPFATLQQPPLQAVSPGMLHAFVQVWLIVLQAWPGVPAPGFAAAQSVATWQPQK